MGDVCSVPCASGVVASGNQAIDWVVWLILALGLCVGQPAADPGAHPPVVSVVGSQAADGGARPPRLFGLVRLGSWAADLDAH